MKVLGMTLFIVVTLGIRSWAETGMPVLEESVTGKWKTIDDETGKEKSIVEIYKDGNEFKGKVTELINPKEDNPVCKKCEGGKKDQPIRGLEILWGMKETEKNKEWAEGHILDPNNGKTYKCRLRLKKPNELEVRGFIGFSLLGRSQNWYRQQ